MNEDFKQAQVVVNEVFYPKLEKQIESLNEYLEARHKIRVGVELNWYFEKVE